MAKLVRDGDTVTLRLSVPVAVVTDGQLGILSVPVVGLGIAGLIAFGSSHDAVGVRIGFQVASVAFVLFGLWGVRYGARLTRKALADTPRILATANTVSMTARGRTPKHLARSRIVRADYRWHYPMRLDPRSVAELTWLNARGDPVATWHLSPHLGRSVGAWFDAAGIDGVVGRPPRPPKR